MNQRINDQQEELKRKEEKILLELESTEKNLKARARTVGKIALISGLVALLAYFGFKAFSDDSPKKSKKKRKKESGGLGQIVTPLIVKFLKDIFDLDDEKPE